MKASADSNSKNGGICKVKLFHHCELRKIMRHARDDKENSVQAVVWPASVIKDHSQQKYINNTLKSLKI